MTDIIDTFPNFVNSRKNFESCNETAAILELNLGI